MNLLKRIQEPLLLLGVFTLPVYQTVNHWFFGVFIAFSFLTLNKKKLLNFDKQILKHILICSGVFFFLRLFTILYTSNIEISIKELTRALPFILYPLAIFTIGFNKSFEFKNFEKKLFYTLTLGCILTAIICWGNIIIGLEENSLPQDKFFGWKKSGAYLTEILDLHPPYLGMLFVGAIIFLFKEIFYNERITKLNKIFNFSSAIFLFLFLFNMTARNALFFLLLTAVLFFIYNKKWKLLVSLILICFLGVLVIVNHPSQYYRLKMYHMLGLSDNEDVKDLRFQRLKASFSVFEKSPIIGVGLGRDIEMKIEEYKLIGDEIAVKKRLNSHNQFFEYLSAYGLLGGIIFITAILYSFYFLFKAKQYFYLLLFLNIVVSTLTESTFERALGIQYYSLIIALTLLLYYNKKTN